MSIYAFYSMPYNALGMHINCIQYNIYILFYGLILSCQMFAANYSM